jgi:hypothetical protein
MGAIKIEVPRALGRKVRGHDNQTYASKYRTREE